MSWQHELQRLDEELAAGRLPAEDYRRRRDELLAQAASTSGNPQASGPSTAEPQQQQPPQQQPPQQPPSPFPAPFRWDPVPAESTQVIPPVPAPVPPVPPPDEGSADSTQVVDRQESEQDAERTQVVPGAPRQQLPPQPGQPPHPGQHGQQGQYAVAPPWSYQESSAPPWAASDLPPMIDPSASWMRQGPEVFDTAGSGRGLRIAGLAIVAVLLVGLIVAGAVYVVQRSGNNTPIAEPTAEPTSQQSPAKPTTTTRTLPEPPPPLPRPEQTPAALIDPPGQVRGGGGPLDLAKLQGAQLFSQPTLDALTDGNMTDGVLKTTTVNGSTVGLYALTVADSKAALHVIDVIGRSNATGGVRPDESREQKGVKVYATAENAKDHVFRAVYVLYDRAIELEVFGPDRAAVQALFDDLLARQLKHAPPTER